MKVAMYCLSPGDTKRDEESQSSDTKPDEHAPESSKTQGIWWYLRHPYTRLTTALSIFVLDFLYYCEDPTVHSHLTTQIPVAGSAITMLLSQWPSTVGLRYDAPDAAAC